MEAIAFLFSPKGVIEREELVQQREICKSAITQQQPQRVRTSYLARIKLQI